LAHFAQLASPRSLSRNSDIALLQADHRGR
jgi:hypothetical protein